MRLALNVCTLDDVDMLRELSIKRIMKLFLI